MPFLGHPVGGRLFVAHKHNSQVSVTTLPRPPSRLGRGGIWTVDSQENH